MKNQFIQYKLIKFYANLCPMLAEPNNIYAAYQNKYCIDKYNDNINAESNTFLTNSNISLMFFNHKLSTNITKPEQFLQPRCV